MMQKVILSQQYLESVSDFQIMQQIFTKDYCKTNGDIKKLAEKFYMLRDDRGNDICTLTDANTFYESLMESDVAQIFSCFN